MKQAKNYICYLSFIEKNIQENKLGFQKKRKSVHNPKTGALIKINK